MAIDKPRREGDSNCPSLLSVWTDRIGGHGTHAYVYTAQKSVYKRHGSSEAAVGPDRHLYIPEGPHQRSGS